MIVNGNLLDFNLNKVVYTPIKFVELSNLYGTKVVGLVSGSLNYRHFHYLHNVMPIPHEAYPISSYATSPTVVVVFCDLLQS